MFVDLGGLPVVEGSADLTASLGVSVVVCGRKAPKSICQQASPGFPRLRSGQALLTPRHKDLCLREIREALRSG
jgi:hypothetical protein